MKKQEESAVPVVAEVIDPAQFGIEKETAEGIEQAFAPAIEERKALSEIYGQLIQKEMTPELCEEAKEFDKQLLQLEKNITATHKTQKDFSLQFGRLCDAWKNKEIEPVRQMRERVGEIKKHFEIEEAKRVEALHVTRKAELDAVGFEGDMHYGELSDTVFTGILEGAKLTKAKRDEDARVAEEQAKESARLEAVRAERRLALATYTDLLEDAGVDQDMAFDMLAEDFEVTVGQLKDLRASKNAEAELARADAARLAEELAEKEAAEEAAKKEAERVAAEAKAREAAIQAKLDAELKAKADAEAAETARLAKEEAARIAAAKAPVKEQLAIWVRNTTMGFPPVDNETTVMIAAKFEGFKKWALSEIEKI